MHFEYQNKTTRDRIRINDLIYGYYTFLLLFCSSSTQYFTEKKSWEEAQVSTETL
jgi:hypothetical protein